MFLKESKAEDGRSTGLGGYSTLDALKEIDHLRTHNECHVFPLQGTYLALYASYLTRTIVPNVYFSRCFT
jgi:hypothetical protein